MDELTAIHKVALILSIGAVAFLYSSVGHGGATGYLAAAALMGLAPAVARPGALWMNCFVATISFWQFRRAGFFDWNLFAPLAAASIPCALIGSALHLEGRFYSTLLAIALAAAGLMLGWGGRNRTGGQPHPPGIPLALLIGALLGFLAGLTGIGGGVFLTPILIVLGWAAPKVAGGISALFIVVNSIAGLAGLGHAALIWQPMFLSLVVIGITGALLGTYLGVHRWPDTTFRRSLAGVLWIAAGKLILTGK
ncbi:MAG: sulfite exporter TauE/SafE family protein [Verrucomicrobiota bacterium]